MNKTSPLILVFAAAVMGAGLGWHLKPEPRLEPRVILPDSAMQRSVPTPPKGLERLERHTVKPAQVARSEGKPGAAAVLAYCRPALNVPTFGASGRFRDSGNQKSTGRDVQDTADPEPRTPVAIAAVLPPVGGTFHDKRLEIHSVLSDGRLWRGAWTHVHQPFAFSSSGDSVWLSEPRLPTRIWQGATQCVKQSPLGAALGLAVGVLLKKPDVGAAAGAGVACADGFIDKVP